MLRPVLEYKPDSRYNALCCLLAQAKRIAKKKDCIVKFNYNGICFEVTEHSELNNLEEQYNESIEKWRNYYGRTIK